MIKRHRPPFNIRLRDDKSYPYIAVTIGDEFPRVMFTRERHRKGVLYFGPYSSAKKVRETLDVLNRVFPYRPCEGPTPGRRSGVPCLDYHIGRCAAPCVGLISREDYAEVIDGIIEFLSGRVRPLERRLEERMKEAAESQEFEEAARYRNRLNAVRHLAERQVADHVAGGSADVLAVAVDGDTANVQVFHLRDGRMSDRRSLYLENAGAGTESDVLWGFALEYYAGQVAIPSEVIVPSVVRGPGAAGELPRRAAGEPGRGARCPARREAADGGAGRQERAAGARARQADVAADAGPADRGAGGAARIAQPGVAAGAHRVLRHLQPGRRRSRRVDGGVRGRRRQALRLPQVRHAPHGRAGRLRDDARGGRPAVRADDDGRRGRLRRQLRRRPEPGA